MSCVVLCKSSTSCCAYKESCWNICESILLFESTGLKEGARRPTLRAARVSLSLSLPGVSRPGLQGLDPTATRGTSLGAGLQQSIALSSGVNPCSVKGWCPPFSKSRGPEISTTCSSLVTDLNTHLLYISPVTLADLRPGWTLSLPLPLSTPLNNQSKSASQLVRGRAS